jgi:hypothetical protein
MTSWSGSTALRAAWFWLRELFGENAYARYVADWQARHAGTQAVGEHLSDGRTSAALRQHVGRHDAAR